MNGIHNTGGWFLATGIHDATPGTRFCRHPGKAHTDYRFEIRTFLPKEV